MRLHRLLASSLVAACWASAAAAQETGDDFELGHFNSAFWTLWSDGGVVVAMAAAHRGSWGMVATLDDVPYLAQASVSSGASLYGLRFWLSNVPPTGVGLRSLAEIDAFGALGQFRVGELLLGYDAGASYLELSQYNPANGTNPQRSANLVYLQNIPIAGPWYLVELGVFGIGATGAQAGLWVDGMGEDMGPAEDLSGLGFAGIKVGVPTVYVPGGTAQLFFDDVRVREGALPASTIDLIAAIPSDAGVCTALSVLLVDSNGGPAPAPYAFPVALADALGNATFYLDLSCTAPISSLHFDAGVTNVEAAFSTPGPAYLIASYIDFMGAGVNVTVGGTNPGPDGGPTDGGRTDAGAAGDAGGADGGPVGDGGLLADGGRAGSGDGGPGSGGGNAAANLGCGCSAGGAAAAFALLALGALVRRKPRFG